MFMLKILRKSRKATDETTHETTQIECSVCEFLKNTEFLLSKNENILLLQKVDGNRTLTQNIVQWLTET